MTAQQNPPPSSLPQSRNRSVTYRKAKPLPVPVLDSLSIWFEEQLYSQAFPLLLSVLTSGTGSRVDAYIPPTQYLALASTLIVHPQLTTRTTSPDKRAAADDALRYLQHVNSLLGAQESGLDRALQISEAFAPSRNKRAKARGSDVGSDTDEQQGQLKTPYIGKESLWTKAPDFWAVVGWAFNCSVVHKHRWERWKLWIGFMIDVLQDDLEHRLPEAERLYVTTQDTAAIAEKLKESMLAQYLSTLGEGRNGKRRLMRAVLADGKAKSLAEFPEVWRGETKLPKQRNDERAMKRPKLDLENGDFGDYYDDDSGDDSQISSARRSRSTTAAPSRHVSRAASGDDDSEDELGADGPTSTDPTTSSIESFGGIDSLQLRMRILALLTVYTTKSPDSFLDTEDLFDLYTEFLRPLPLPIFQHFALPPKPWLGPNSQASLNQMLLRPLLVASAPAYNENSLTQAEFETYYAPFAANNSGAGDNAKVSLLVESLLRLLWVSGNLVVTKELRRAVETGVKARREKVAWDGRKKVGGRVQVDEEAAAVMRYSGERMRVVLDVAAEQER